MMDTDIIYEYTCTKCGKQQKVKFDLTDEKDKAMYSIIQGAILLKSQVLCKKCLMETIALFKFVDEEIK